MGPGAGQALRPEEDGHAPRTTGTAVLPPGLGESLGWLLAQVLRASNEAVDRAVAGFPHGSRGYQALCGAAHRSARNQAELAAQLGLDRTVMVRLVDDLSGAGMVERVQDPADRRGRLVRATPAGFARLAAMQDAIEAAESELLAALPTEEQARLRTLLSALASRRSARRVSH